MAVSIQKFREIVFQLIYSYGFGKGDAKALILLLMKQHAITQKAAGQMTEKASNIWERAGDLDREIEKHSIDFPIEKIGMVEKALLRQGIYELLDGSLPPKVVISEAVRLSKKFATAESGAFVNALLDSIYKEREHAFHQTEPILA